MNIRTKLILSVGVLAGMIILLVALSVVNLQILTATEPDSPAAVPGLQRALLWISVIGGVCIFASIILLVWLPRSISKPIQELTRGILEIANHNYEKRLDMSGREEFREVADSFNRMAERLTEYRASTLNDILSAKKFLEAIVNSIDEPIIGLNRNREILFINNEALTVLNLKREEVIRRSAEELSLKNDLLRRLVRELVNPGEKKEPLKIYADNKESYFKASYITIINAEADDDEPHNLGDVILLKNITEFKELDSAKTTFISTISHELKTPISAILMSLQLLEDKRVGVLNDEQEQLSNSIKENADRLLGITGELLNMTQVEAGKLQMMPKITKPIELIEYAIKANQVQADKFGIQIEVEYPEEKMPKLFVDSEKIAWVLTNLLSNAIRYSKENGRVVIGAKHDEDFVEMYVQDFGKGQSMTLNFSSDVGDKKISYEVEFKADRAVKKIQIIEMNKDDVKIKKTAYISPKIKQYQMQKDTAYVIINEQLIGMKGQTINRQKIHSAKKNFTYKWKQLGDDGVLTPTDLKFKK